MIRLDKNNPVERQSVPNTISPELIEFAENNQNGFDLSLAQNSNHIVYQIQTMNTLSVDDVSGEWVEGNVTIYTTAYHQGYDQVGDARYLVKAEVVFSSPLNPRNEDIFVLSHSANGVFDSNGVENGEMFYRYEHFSYKAGGMPSVYSQDFTDKLTPDYGMGAGIGFKVRWYKDTYRTDVGEIVQNTYSNWKLTGSYYVITTDTTNIGVSYVHNQQILGNNLSISIGYCGITANLDIVGRNKSYDARSILLYNI